MITYSVAHDINEFTVSYFRDFYKALQSDKLFISLD